MQSQQAQQLLAELQHNYPQAFKYNFLYYGQIKTKGVWDEPKKELIPWLLAAMIFLPTCILLQQFVSKFFMQMPTFDSYAYAVLSILLFFMWIVPFIMKQIRHSSHSLYQLLRHTPTKIAVIIVLQALNLAYLQSYFVLCLLFFFGLSFGFVRFYKENMFRERSDAVQYFQLQQLRRVCFWSYKQTLKLRCQLCFKSTKTSDYSMMKTKLNHFADLYTQLLKAEHQYCKSIKFTDIDSYLDEML